MIRYTFAICASRNDPGHEAATLCAWKCMHRKPRTMAPIADERDHLEEFNKFSERYEDRKDGPFLSWQH